MTRSSNSRDVGGAPGGSEVQASLAGVALVDIRDICRAGKFCEAHFRGEIRAGRAPQPIRFGVRCSRWPAEVIREYLRSRIELAASSSGAAQFTVSRAKLASAAAQARRRTKTADQQAAK